MRFGIQAGLAALAALALAGCSEDEGPAAPAGGAGGEQVAPGGGGGGGGEAGGGNGGAGGSAIVLPTSTDHARLAEAIRVLASEELGGRRSGTPSGVRTEDFLIEALEAAGLAPIVQPVPFAGFSVAPPAELAVEDEHGAFVPFAYVDEWREAVFSGAGRAEGELVFVGWGIVSEALDSYADVDVSGKVVAMLTGAPRAEGIEPADGRFDRKVRTARDRGAAGVIFVLAGPYLSHGKSAGPELQLTAGNLGGGIDPAVHVDDLPVASVHLDATRKLLGKSAIELGADTAPFATGKRVRLEVHGATAPEASCRNVIVAFPGADADDAVVIGAHHDHLGAGADGSLFPGASDNATGTAVVLEVARTLATIEAPPRRTVVLALFCAEEVGLFGSTAFVAEEPAVATADTALMVAVDFLGNDGPPSLTNYDGSDEIATFIGNALRDPELPIVPLDYGGGCASDDCPYLDAGVAAYRFLSVGDHHHRRTDVAENLSMPIVERVAEVVLDGVLNVAWR